MKSFVWWWIIFIWTLFGEPCDSGVTRSIVSGRTGKDWLKIKGDWTRVVRYSVINLAALDKKRKSCMNGKEPPGCSNTSCCLRGSTEVTSSQKVPQSTLCCHPLYLEVWSNIYFWHGWDISAGQWLCHITPMTCQQSFNTTNVITGWKGHHHSLQCPSGEKCALQRCDANAHGETQAA